MGFCKGSEHRLIICKHQLMWIKWTIVLIDDLSMYFRKVASSSLWLQLWALWSLVTPKGQLGKCFTQARVARQQRGGQLIPPGILTDFPPEELGHRRWWVLSRTFCSSDFYGRRKSFTGLAPLWRRFVDLTQGYPCWQTISPHLRHQISLFSTILTSLRERTRESDMDWVTSPVKYTVPRWWAHQKEARMDLPLCQSGEIGDKLPWQLF